ncbi:MAG: hypothetical protein H3C69_09255 [Candidatus Promineofilum sp.]|nr:hypothetical protein [Promineifilum sp.]
MMNPFVALGLAIVIVVVLIFGGLIILGLIGRAVARDEDEYSQDGEWLGR